MPIEKWSIEVSETDRPEDRDPIERALLDHNARHAPPSRYSPLRLLLRDAQQVIVGGLIGHSSYDWLFISVLIVPEELRGNGLGRTLMLQAEAIARSRRLTGVWLDTFSFQARPFYEKLGYTIFGELKDHPLGISQYWLMKRFDEALGGDYRTSSATLAQ